MNQTVLQIARHYVKGEKLKEGMLNRVEAGIRAYDPCLSCSTHAYGEMPLAGRAARRRRHAARHGGARLSVAEVDCPDSVLVIAWGNPLREDDGVAWHVLEGLRALQPRPWLPALRLRHAHQLTPELAECVSRAAGVVFVDARRDGTPGEVRCRARRRPPPARTRSPTR